jgi:hypothetical protein
MTLEKFFERFILPILGENPDAADTYDEENIVGVSNTVFSECLDLNNRIFKRDGKEALDNRFYELGDELPFDERLMKECCVYGICARLIIDDAGTDATKIGFLEDCYQRAREKYSNIYMGQVVQWLSSD